MTELIEQAKETFSFNKKDADSDIGLAIRKCESEITDLYTRKSTWYSLPKKAKKYIDKPFLNFIKNNNLSTPNWKISELAELKFSTADLLLEEWSKTIDEKCADRHQQIFETVCALRHYLNLCSKYIPGKKEILRLGDDGIPTPGYYQPRRTGKQIVDKIPSFLRFDHEGYCELCFKKTASQEKFEEIARLDNGLDPKVSYLIEERVKFNAEGFSSKYCHDHQDIEETDEVTGKKKRKKNPNRKKHEARRIHFYSAIRLIEDIGAVSRSIGIETDLLRRYAYWLVYYPSRISTSLKLLPLIVARYQIERHKGIDELTLLLQNLEAESNSKKSWAQKCLINEPINLKRQTDVEWMLSGILLQQSLLARK